MGPEGKPSTSTLSGLTTKAASTTTARSGHDLAIVSGHGERATGCHPESSPATRRSSHLDPSSAASVIQMLTRLRDLIGATILVATHSPAVAAFAQARYEVGPRDRAET
jgi:ABC-type methionine transport system ATPase subunit